MNASFFCIFNNFYLSTTDTVFSKKINTISKKFCTHSKKFCTLSKKFWTNFVLWVINNMPIIWIQFKQIWVKLHISVYQFSLIIRVVSLVYKENKLTINNLLNVVYIEKEKTKGCRRRI